MLAALFTTTGSGIAATAPDKHTAGADSSELLNSLDYFAAPRLAPNGIYPGAGYLAAVQAAAALPSTAGSWHEVGPYNYFTDDQRYADPTFSNTGSGERYVSGRIAAAASTDDGSVILAGGADGGVWRSTDFGSTWKPVTDGGLSLSTGALTIDQSNGGCIAYIGTGEANTSSDSYAGVGLLKSTDCGATFSAFGPSDLVGALIWRIRVDGPRIFVASSHGLYRSGDGGSSWSNVLDPAGPGSLTGNQVTDVAVRPGTSQVLAAIGWRNGASTNGLYLSNDDGQTFSLIANPNGWVPSGHEGRVTLQYSKDGSQLYAIDEDPTLLTASGQGVATVLGGIYSAKGGDPNGPWNQIATASKLMNSGSAEKISTMGRGYQPGIQAWYNQFLAVDPKDPLHLYAGLEEVYQTRDGGNTWTTVGPYWNLTLPCFSYTTFEGSCNHDQTHPDQHAAFIAGDRLYVGNDGGMWSRALGDDTAGNWTSLNRNLNTLQFYFAGAGKKASDTGVTYYGGLQDNGTAKVFPQSQTINFFGSPVTEDATQPFGGDGTNVIVDPSNPDNVITSYVYLTLARSANGGQSWKGIAPSDPNPRFVAPARADKTDGSHLIAGGQYFWESKAGFNTNAADWQATFNAGSGHSITAIDTANGVSYAAWCGPVCNPNMATGSNGSFGRGIATNAGGAWHDITGTLPMRYITGIWADAANGNHVIATVSGYSRRWIKSPVDPGVGHIFESNDAGAHWNDITGNLPDIPTNDAYISPSGKIAVATDIGAFVSDAGHTTWSRLGGKLPNVVIDSWALAPDGNLVAATHGRGLWTFPISSI